MKISNFKFQISNFQKGQTLVTLLFFMVIAITVVSAGVTLIMINNLSTSKLEQGVIARQVAESGIENALLRLLRNPGYTGESNLVVGDGEVDISVATTGANEKTITAIGSVNNMTRTVRVTVDDSGFIAVTSWREVL